MAIFQTDNGLFEVIDDQTGNVLDTFYRYVNAMDRCRELGVSARNISWASLDGLRKQNGITGYSGQGTGVPSDEPEEEKFNPLKKSPLKPTPRPRH